MSSRCQARVPKLSSSFIDPVDETENTCRLQSSFNPSVTMDNPSESETWIGLFMPGYSFLVRSISFICVSLSQMLEVLPWGSVR
jgi:hypothetical protein